MTDKKEHFKAVVAINVLLIKDNKVLLGKRINTGWGDGLWGVVGGHVDGGELPTFAASREALEEVGLKIDPKNLKHIRTCYLFRSDHERIEIDFVADSWEGEVENQEPQKCEKVEWFALDNLPEVNTYTKQLINDYLNNIKYFEADERS